jgi:hypothetical protein
MVESKQALTNRIFLIDLTSAESDATRTEKLRHP